MWNKIKFRIGWWIKHPLLWVLLAIIIFHLPTLLEPLWYWDSGFYQVIGQGMVQGKLLYVDLWDNKLPGIYLIFSLFYKLFGHEQAFLHGFLTIWIFATAVMLFKLAQSLFNRKIAIASAWVFAFLTLPPVCTGGIPNAEIFMILPNAIAFYILFKDTRKATWWKALLSGLFLGLGFYFKMVAVFELIAAGLILGFLALKRKQYVLIFYVLPLIIGFLLPFGLTAVYYYRLGYLSDFIGATLTHNAGYIEDGNAAKYSAYSILLSKLGHRLIATLVSTLVVFTLYVTKKIKSGTMIALTWFIYSLFGALFSGRDWNHYFVQVFSSGSLVIALLLQKIHPLITSRILAVKTSGIVWMVMSILLTAVFIGSMATHNPYSYYENVILYVAGRRSKTDYDWQINWGVPTRDRVVEYLNNHLQPNETFFNYSSDAWIYALTNRYPPTKYVVMYHLTGIEDAHELTMNALRSQPPKYVVKYEYVEEFDEFFVWLDANYTLEYTTGDAQIYKLDTQ